MHNKAPITFAFLAVLSDCAATVIGLAFAFWLRFHSGLFGAPKGVPSFDAYLSGFLFTAFGWVAIFAFLGLYRIRRGLTASEEGMLLLKGALLGALVAMSSAFLYRGVSYSRLYLALAVPAAYLAVLGGRAAIRALRACCRRRDLGVQRVLLVGGGPLLEGVRRRIELRPDLGYRIVGGLADPGLPLPEGIPPLGPIDAVADVCKREGVSRVFIVLPESHRERTVDVLRACENLPLEFEIVPDIFGKLGERMRVSDMDGIPMLVVKDFPLEAWNRFLKRTFDIAGSALLLVLLAPLFLLLAIVVRLDSPGPVFYRQRRIGRDGRVFDIVKYRSMVQGAEKETGPVWSGRGDERRTRVGAFLRRTSLDELPQLGNVLIGQMSLVGPRPERPFFVRRFERDIPRYFDRHRVKSGMTGWAQVNGLRGDTSIEERTRFDVFYVENWSVYFDVKILLLTARHVVEQAIRAER
ncbi:MAG: undecaprenyl-phosphate glucose phosphotransferase [Candidatus Eisenbacteria bacterium]|nr:undecaprenyl-phosphate glucose phosphotransferase [Candidatus Eisenbacteria bacterium]